MSAQTGFDGKAELFAQRIYGSRKGALRLALLWEQLCQQVLEPWGERTLEILDLGAGIGQLSARLAARGHRLTLVDASADMLRMAQDHFAEEGVSTDGVSFRQLSLAEVQEQVTGQYDLVICHAVLEWLRDPWQGLAIAAARVRSGGILSLAYYNRHALVYRNLLHGNFDRIRREHYSGHEGGFTPLSPIVPNELEARLPELGMQPLYRAGLRTFSDFMPARIADKRGFEEILEMERQFAEQEPFRSLGRYQHLICRKV